MSSSNCCFLTCIQVSQETGQVVWYSHLLQNFPQFFVIHSVKGFGIINKAEMDVFLELSCFSDDQWMLAVWSLVPLLFLKPAWTFRSSWFTYCWSLTWRILSITLLACEMRAIVGQAWCAAVHGIAESWTWLSDWTELMLKLKLQYFGHLMQRVNSGKDPDAGKDWRQKGNEAGENEMVR